MMTGRGLVTGGSMLPKVDRLRVMVVDDPEETRWVIRTILVAFGVQRICEASGHEEVFKKLRSFQPDLLLIDYQMADCDGLELTRRLRRDREDPFTPIILMTSEATPEVLCAARDAGANEFLAKPITPASLRAHINAVIVRPRNFISNRAYFGPDRRRLEKRWGGLDRRSPEAGPPPTEAPAEAAKARPSEAEVASEESAEQVLRHLQEETAA